MYPLEFFFHRSDTELNDLGLLMGRARAIECERVARLRAEGATSNKAWPLDVKLEFIQQAQRVANFYAARLIDPCYPNPPCPPLP